MLLPPANSVLFNSINVNSIDAGSGIFVGSNLQWYWAAREKDNYGFGIVLGFNNLIQTPLNIVTDPDIIDNPGI